MGQRIRGVDGKAKQLDNIAEGCLYRMSDVWTLGDTLDVCMDAAGWTGEVETVRRDGSRFPAYVVCSRLHEPSGGAAGSVYLVLDITDRKEAEEALRYSEEKYSTLVESSATGIFIIRDDRLTFVNPNLAKMLEYPVDELIGSDASALVHPGDRGRILEIGRKRTAGEAVPEEYECRLVTKTGHVRWVSMRNTLIPHRGGTVTLGNVQDVTERKRAEGKLHALSERLLTAQEEERKRVAQELHDSVGQALSAIKFVVERALSDTRPNDRRKSTQALRSVVPTVQSAVEEVRRISMALRPSSLDDLGLLATVFWFARELQSTYPGVRVELQMEGEEREISEALKIVVFRVLQEATNNVFKHSGAGRLLVKVRKDEEGLELVVEDDGLGFDPETVAADPQRKGFGLGTMRERTELSGGVFTLKSASGAGTTVRAFWPDVDPPTA